MSGEAGKTGKVYCANCIHCKIVVATAHDGHPIKKIRCATGHWKKKLGEEKLYKYANSLRRIMPSCPDYDGMGDPGPFIKDLRRTLPSSKEDAHIID